MSGEQFSLVWNSFPRNLSSGLYTFLTDEHFVDVTLAAEGQILRAHKLILSVCSTYFRELFKGNTCKHPIVILKDVNYRDLSAMLHFMYQGEVNIKQEDIASFLKVAETLQIKGLTKDSDEEKLTDNTEVLDRLLRTRKDEEDELNEPETSLETLEKLCSPLEKTPDTPERDIITSHSIESGSASVEKGASFCNTSNPQGSDSEVEHVMHNIRSMFDRNCDNVDELTNSREDEPLDYTSDIGRISRTKKEHLDYHPCDIEMEASGYKNYTAQEKIIDQENFQRQDFVPNSPLIPYNQSCQNEQLGFSNLEAAFPDDFPYNPTDFSRGKRTVKGLPNSTLPLEATLRVVSELGPTLRMERGKVIRVYSCPWCLRHFTRKENLKLHVRYIHGPLESLTCKLCGNKYKNSNSLRVHSYLYHNAKRNKHNKPPPVNGNL